jgi:hypothetical protein
MGRATGDGAFVAATKRWSASMSKQNDLSRCLVALEQDATLIAVIEMGQASWLVAGIVPGLDRCPLKKLGPDRDALLQLLHRWRSEAAKVGHAIDRIAVAYEAGRDGFWLARWLRSQSIEAYVIHPSSVPVSASTDGRKQIGSTRSCSSAPFSAGCAANRSTAAWRQSRRGRGRQTSRPRASDSGRGAYAHPQPPEGQSRPPRHSGLPAQSGKRNFAGRDCPGV